MLKSLIIGILTLALAIILKNWSNVFKETSYQDALSSLEEISIRSYSNSGIEWIIKGRSLTAKGQRVEFQDVKLYYSDSVLTSKGAVFNRQTGNGLLYNGVNLKSKELDFSTDSSYINMKEGLIWGDSKVELKLSNSHTLGEGFKIQTDSEKISIFKVRTSIE
ncbi:MAG: LPS export ABC transporter periplasmic protein LptC [Aquificaceae bacterium]